jgi:hypothetical protein
MSRGIPAYESVKQNKGAVGCTQDYSGTESCRPKIPAVFGDKFKNFRGVSQFVFVYSTIFYGILVDKHWFKVPVL